MKKSRIIMCLMLFSITAFGGHSDIDSVVNEKDKICSVKEFIHGGNIYFHINVLNETEDTFYSLIKYQEGQEDKFSSVDICEGYANSINTPIFYSFKDVEISDKNMKYKLIAIRADGSHDIAEWTFTADNNSIRLEYVKDTIDKKKSIPRGISK